MPDAFVPLHAWLRDGSEPEPQEAPATAVTPEVVFPESPAAEETTNDTAEALADVRRFRASLADALDVAVAEALREVVAGVLARELMIAPVDVAAIVSRVRAQYAGEEILAIHLHPDECEACEDMDVAIVADASLRRGDVVVRVRSGSIDATLGARIDDVLHAFEAA